MSELRFESVSRWTSRLRPNTAGINLYTFGSWLRWLEAKGFESDPDRLVEMQKSSQGDDRFRILDLAQEFCSSLGGRLSSKRRYYSTIRSFFMHNRADLPLDRSFQLRSDVPKSKGKLNPENFRALLGGCSRMYRAIFLCMFQGAMDEEGFYYWNMTGLGDLRKQMDSGARILRVDLPGRKKNRNDLPFYTFIGRDAIEAVKLYLEERPRNAKAIFVNQYGHPVTKRNVYIYWLRHLYDLGLITKMDGGSGNRYGLNPHEVRDMFKTRFHKSGGDLLAAEFFMGHIDKIDRDEYDKFYEDEDYTADLYRKSETWLNIVSEDPERVPARDLRRLQEELAETRRAIKEADWLFSDPEAAAILKRMIGEEKSTSG